MKTLALLLLFFIFASLGIASQTSVGLTVHPQASTQHNILLTIGGVTPPSPCTYPGSGDWTLDCSENCILTDATNIDGQWVLIGAGLTQIKALITVTEGIYKENDCTLYIESGTGSIE